MQLIQRSFIDSGNKVEDDGNLGLARGNANSDSDYEFSGAQENLVSEWQVNQHSICFNLPALALFISNRNFFETLFPHLQSLSGNLYVNPKLSLVLPQTCLCVKDDHCRLKIMELICQIGSLALSDQDCNLMRSIFKDIHLLFKAYYPGEENTGLMMQQQLMAATMNFPQSTAYFKTHLSAMVFKIFESSQIEWRAYEQCLDFFQKNIQYMVREDVREKYVPCILQSLKTQNNSIKLTIVDILVFMLVNNADSKCRNTIHHFLNEELAVSGSIYNRKLYLTFCGKISPRVSKKYFKDVFAWHFLKIGEEKKKDIAILFAKNVVAVRKKLDDVSSVSRMENYLMSNKNLFHKDAFIQALCQKQYH